MQPKSALQRGLVRNKSFVLNLCVLAIIFLLAKQVERNAVSFNIVGLQPQGPVLGALYTKEEG